MLVEAPTTGRDVREGEREGSDRMHDMIRQIQLWIQIHIRLRG